MSTATDDTTQRWSAGAARVPCGASTGGVSCDVQVSAAEHSKQELRSGLLDAPQEEQTFAWPFCGP